MNIKDIQKHGKTIEDYLRLQTYCLGIKLLKNESEIPEEALRPLKDFGHHLSQCQSFARSRREGLSIAQFKDDHWCFEPVIGYGLEKIPGRFFEAPHRYPGAAKTKEAAQTWARNFPRLEYGLYEGIVSAPLTSVTFEPDLVMLYCIPEQLTELMTVVNWIDGKDIYPVLSGHSACVYSIVPVIHNGTFHVTVPCLGDRKRAMAQNNEMIFSFPLNKIKDLTDGLIGLKKEGDGLPVRFCAMPEYKMSEGYEEMGKMLGLEI